LSDQLDRSPHLPTSHLQLLIFKIGMSPTGTECVRRPDRRRALSIRFQSGVHPLIGCKGTVPLTSSFPVLFSMALKSIDNPPARSTDDLFDLEKPWWVARTKSRKEKALAWSLNKAGINYYLPLVARPQKNRNRLRISILPLFPGYLFFRGTDRNRYEALTTGRIAQIIAVIDQPSLNNELRAISRVADGEEELELCDFIKEGNKARIVYGPLAGTEGIIEGGKNKTRIILLVQAIRQAVRIEVNIDHVQLL